MSSLRFMPSPGPSHSSTSASGRRPDPVYANPSRRPKAQANMGVCPSSRRSNNRYFQTASYFQHNVEKGTEMTWIAISIPVIVLALAIATVPVIFAMVARQKLPRRLQSARGRWARARRPANAPDRGASTRARRVRSGSAIMVTAGGLGAVVVGVALPAPAGAAMAGSSVYVSDQDSNMVASYPTSANGDAPPSVPLATSVTSMDRPCLLSTPRATCGWRTFTTTPWSSSPPASSPQAAHRRRP